ncbi:MAG TPA: MarR family transcriptional regulator [Alphaproteobacteria bacterium]|nr:MarR family transcriptional regulator [Alphaproteobacteria bacterium]
MSKTGNARPLADPEYRALAEFRYQLRKFLRHMEERVRDIGVNPQQYQLMLAIKGLPLNMTPTISVLADRMQLNHNSMVELVDRCEERDLISRVRSSADRRQVTLSITQNGEALLDRLVSASRQELRSIGPILVESILRLILDRDSAQAGSLAKAKRKAHAKTTIAENA